MKKDPNSITGRGIHDQALPRSAVLRGKRNFERLFSQSNVIKASTVQLRYRIYKDPSEGCLIGFIVSKKLGKATKRNRIKRLLREVYRTHQHLLTDLFAKDTFGFHGVFMARQIDLTYSVVQEDMILLIKKIRAALAKNSTGTQVSTRKKKE